MSQEAKKNQTWRKDGFAHLSPIKVFNDEAKPLVTFYPNKCLVTGSLPSSLNIYMALKQSLLLSIVKYNEI